MTTNATRDLLDPGTNSHKRKSRERNLNLMCIGIILSMVNFLGVIICIKVSRMPLFSGGTKFFFRSEVSGQPLITKGFSIKDMCACTNI